MIAKSATCRRCKVPIAMSGTPAPGQQPHQARGLCVNCWVWAGEQHVLNTYPRVPRSGTVVLQQFETTRAEHPDWTVQRIAAHIDHPYGALRQVVSRATRRKLHRSPQPGGRVA